MYVDNIYISHQRLRVCESPRFQLRLGHEDVRLASRERSRTRVQLTEEVRKKNVASAQTRCSEQSDAVDFAGVREAS